MNSLLPAAGFNIKVVSRYTDQSAMTRAKISVFIFSVLLIFHCCNGKYLLVETEDGGHEAITGEGYSSGMGSSEEDPRENKAVNRKDNCDFCEPDTPGVYGYGIG